MKKFYCKTDYKYIIAGICFIIVFAGLGFCSTAKTIYFAPITEAMGFSRSSFSINDSCRYITTAIVNIFFGTLVEKFGTKKLIIAGMLSLIVSSLLYSCATTLFMFYLGGFFLGIGVAWTTTSMVGVVVNRWFEQNKGAVMGFILASNGIGAAHAINIVTPIIYKSTFGYQSAYKLTAIILSVITLLIFPLYKEKKGTDSQTKSCDTPVQNQSGIEYGELIKKPYFYAIIGVIFLNMLVTVGEITTPHFTDIGLSPSFVTKILGLKVILLAVFKLMFGFIYDRLVIKFPVKLCLISVIISKILLLLITNSLSGKILTIVYCVVCALGLPLETVMLPIIALHFFGQKCYNKTLGIITSVATVGQTLGTPLLNLFYDHFKNYDIVFVLSTAVSVLALIIMNLAMNTEELNHD